MCNQRRVWCHIPGWLAEQRKGLHETCGATSEALRRCCPHCDDPSEVYMSQPYCVLHVLCFVVTGVPRVHARTPGRVASRSGSGGLRSDPRARPATAWACQPTWPSLALLQLPRHVCMFSCLVWVDQEAGLFGCQHFGLNRAGVGDTTEALSLDMARVAENNNCSSTIVYLDCASSYHTGRTCR